MIKSYYNSIRSIHRTSFSFKTYFQSALQISKHFYSDNTFSNEFNIDDEKPKTFSSLGLNDLVVRQINNKTKWESPTLIQELVLPMALKRKSMIISSETGQGKTAAYLIPIINDISTTIINEKDNSLSETSVPGPKALILTPTTQLAYQIANQSVSLAKDLGINTFAITGEMDISKQVEILSGENKPDILVGTLGRLMVCLGIENFDSNNASEYSKVATTFKNLRTVVVDEIDMMMGTQNFTNFAQLFRYIKKSTKGNDIQTMFVSASITENLRNQLSKFAKTRSLMLFDMNNDFKIPSSIKQIVYTISLQRKYSLLKYFLSRKGKVSLKQKKVIVFVRTIQKATRISERLLEDGFLSPACLHSELSKSEKLEIAKKFNTSPQMILVATEFAARGLDFDSVDAVVNFDIPQHPIDYLHRVGRTGRLGENGLAISFLSKNDQTIKLSDSRLAVRDEKIYMDKIENFFSKHNSNKIEHRKIPGPFKDISKPVSDTNRINSPEIIKNNHQEKIKSGPRIPSGYGVWSKDNKHNISSKKSNNKIKIESKASRTGDVNKNNDKTTYEKAISGFQRRTK
ncbi:hypothetical protein BB558_003374 [Smittium angustum]|uniref:RNA helicase n=1 Tax=Smittium angustum TaxID=133377 RepID=A0A2U1J666_SMIAN|nr:hypothetical protein BB558_003374 [Smittium angustum]